MRLAALPALLIAASLGAHAQAFDSMQQRGKMAMGVDQYTSTHVFDDLPNGGRIELQRDSTDSAGVAKIRKHFAEIATAFKGGNFSSPEFVHAQSVSGTGVMAAKRAEITYTVKDLPRGAELLITTTDPAAVAAIHEFFELPAPRASFGGNDALTAQDAGPGTRRDVRDAGDITRIPSPAASPESRVPNTTGLGAGSTRQHLTVR